MNSKYFTHARLGLVRVAVVSPELRVADVAFNTQAIIASLLQAKAGHARLVVFPELCIPGYTSGDLFYQVSLIEACKRSLIELANAARDNQVSLLVGLPYEYRSRIFNCAALITCDGAIKGVVPKQYLPNRSEFYEDRWFVRGGGIVNTYVDIAPEHARVPFGTDLVFDAVDLPGCSIGIEICEDLWAVEPPSGTLALAGATLILNGSGSPDQLTKGEYRRDLVRLQSARCICAYAYAGSGPSESTADVVFGGHSLICENGSLLAETQRFELTTQFALADLDFQRLAHERWNNSSFAAAIVPVMRHVPIQLNLNGGPVGALSEGRLLRPLARLPFVPSHADIRARSCEEVFAIQSTGLAKRLKHTGVRTVTIGISGGLDSTLALLVTIRAFDKLGLHRSGICAITMPGFGTTSRTYDNAVGLMKSLGVTAREVSIIASVRQHFADIGHDESHHDVTYENAQARERTQILMDSANELGGFVVGTGDLSETALGWMTFNGDHMSMYHVNTGVPKTLVRYLIDWCADSVFDGETTRILHDIAATPISPELLPLDAAGAQQQKTEDTVGPYELHDFFLFYAIRYGFAPAKVYFLATQAFSSSVDDGSTGDAAFTNEIILKWLRVFYARFFSQQFKRNAMPDGPKVGSVALSPRGDWRMPSDASWQVWRAELDEIAT